MTDSDTMTETEEFISRLGDERPERSNGKLVGKTGRARDPQPYYVGGKSAIVPGASNP